MPRETVEIKVANRASYEAPAEFISYLAYPDNADDRRNFWIVLCRNYLKLAASKDDRWAWRPQPIEPGFFVTHTENEARKIFNKGFKKLSDRLASAVGIAHYHVSLAKEVDGLPPTVNDLIERMMGPDRLNWKNEKGDSGATAKSKIWMPSRPVIHAAVAYVWLYDAAAVNDYNFPPREAEFPPLVHSAYCFMDQPDNVFYLVELSEAIRLSLLQYQHPNRRTIYREEQMIKFVISPSLVKRFWDYKKIRTPKSKKKNIVRADD
jgi:hypothetical protein